LFFFEGAHEVGAEADGDAGGAGEFDGGAAGVEDFEVLGLGDRG
jgi:hypothetical protein